MNRQRTLAIIKPDAVQKGHVGHIISRIEAEPFRIVAMKLTRLDPAGARAFYHEHCGQGFFAELCEYMSSGPVVVLLLEGDDAVARWREMIGPTDAAVAPPGTIRGDFGESVAHNAVHGSDVVEHARHEIEFFFGNEPRHA